MWMYGPLHIIPCWFNYLLVKVKIINCIEETFTIQLTLLCTKYVTWHEKTRLSSFYYKLPKRLKFVTGPVKWTKWTHKIWLAIFFNFASSWFIYTIKLNFLSVMCNLIRIYRAQIFHVEANIIIWLSSWYKKFISW